MKNALAPVATLLVGVSILLTGLGLQGTLLPVRASLEAFSTFSIGVMGAFYFLGFTLGCLKGGELVKNVGHVRVFLAMTALGSASPLVHGMILDPIAWSLLRFLTGFCFAVLFVVIESWLNDRSSNEDRGIVFSTYVMITLTVMAAGQMMTLLYDPTGLELFLIASVLVSIGAVPVALSKSQSPDLPLEADVNLKKLFRISPSGSIGCLGAGLANGGFWSLAPVFTASVSDDASLAALFMTSTVFGGALAQWPMGFLSDKLGRRKAIVAAATAGMIVSMIIVMSSENLGVVGINLLGAIWGFCAFPMYAVAIAHTNDYADASDYVMVSSGLLLLFGAGAILGPFFASAFINAFGGVGLYAWTGAVHLVLGLYILQRVFRHESSPSEQHIAFGDALATAQTASQVYEEEIQYQEDQDTGAED
ncbi:MAG: MFS transporter [Woeseiaceae bacterium]